MFLTHSLYSWVITRKIDIPGTASPVRLWRSSFRDFWDSHINKEFAKYR